MSVRVMTVTESLRDGRIPVLTQAAFVRIAEAVTEAERAGDVLLLVPARPETFCAGADLDDARSYADRPDDYLDAVAACWAAVESAGVPVVAAVDGPAVGGAFELCLAADAVVASTRAWFSLPEATFGLPPISAARRLAAAVGTVRARRLLLSGRRVTADEAFRMGLATSIGAPEDLEWMARSVAEGMDRVDADAARAVKEVLAVPATDADTAREWFLRALGSEGEA